jgi:hypothetical protein
MTKRLLAGLLFCLPLVTSALPSRAQPFRDAVDDPLVKLEKAGWKIVQDGVLQRQMQPGLVETFVFGVEGFTWKLREMGGQLAFLQRKLKENPTPELRRAIASHRKAIASTLEALERARAAEASGETILPKTDCTISFSHKVHASYKTDRQGTWADAIANFSVAPGCGISGEVYAFAFAQTTVNGASSTMTVTDGPRSGTNVSASADANRNGGEPCESFAFAEVTSSAMNPSSSSVSQTNALCPAPQGEEGGGYCPQCTTYADGSQCCVSCTCDASGTPIACTDHYCPPPGEGGGEGRD